MGKLDKFEEDFAQLARLSLLGDEEELRLFLARAVRRYRRTNEDLASRLGSELEAAPTSSSRRVVKPSVDRREMSAHEGSALSVLREPSKSRVQMPVLESSLEAQISGLLDERRRADELGAHGLVPVSSAIFVGPPGVGKTLTARWIAQQLQMPMVSLDLTAVMSSRLGQSGANLRSALDFARSNPTVLFLDEVDSIAKRRADDSDIGELKRLVTIMLQELDEWPSTSLLLAATNHPELVDPALWRRFDTVIDFPMPSGQLVQSAVTRALAADLEKFQAYVPALSAVMDGRSYSDIERDVLSMRKAAALKTLPPEQAAGALIRGGVEELNRSARIELALELVRQTQLSQHQVARLTTVSRETIRKHSREGGAE